MSPAQTVLWKPHSGQQMKYFRRREFEVLFGGAKGGGKSECLLIDAIRDASHPRYRGLILRRQLKDAEDLIDRSLRLFPSIFPGARFNKNEAKWYFPSGATLQFGHAKEEADVYAYNGREFHFIGFDELQEFTLKQYLFMFSVARSSVPELRPRIRATANPGGIGHVWIDMRFGITRGMAEKTIRDPDTGLTRVFIPSSYRDNPSIDPMYVANLMTLPDKLRRAYMEGDWTVFAGQFFDTWDPKVHVLPEHLEPNPSWPVWHSFDWGYDQPYAYLLFTMIPPNTLYLFGELYGWGGEPNVGARQEAETVARKIRVLWRALGLEGRHIIGPAGHDLWRKNDQTGIDTAELFAMHGVQFVQANTDRIQGWNACRNLLERNPDGTRRFVVSPRCEHFIRTIPTLVHDEHRVEDVAKGAEDHAADAWRYMAMYRPGPDQPAYRPSQAEHGDDEIVLRYRGVPLVFAKPTRTGEWWE